MKNINKNWRISLAFLMIFAMVFQIIGPIASEYTYAEGGEGKLITENIIDNVDLTFPEGSEFEGFIDPKTPVKLEYYWSLKDEWVIKNNDYIILGIPEVFNLGDSDFEGSLKDYGVWYIDVTKRELKLVFNEEVEEKSEVSGKVEINLNLRLNEIVVEVPYDIIIPISGKEDKKFTIKTRPENGSSINKKGNIFKKGTDEKDINKQTWIIDINTSLDTISNPILKDKIDDRLKYIDKSLKIYELKVYSNGTTELGELITIEDIVKDGPSYNHPYIETRFIDEIDKAYRIIYDTEIDENKFDTSKTDFKYTNYAEFNGKNDNATVTVTRGKLIEKDGKPIKAYNPDSINWKIFVNRSLYKLSGVKIEDTIPEGLIFEEDVQVVSKPEETHQKLNNDYKYTWDGDERTFTIEFLNEVDQEYLIEYNTKIDPEYLKNNSEEISFENKAKLTHESLEDGTEAPKEVKVKKGTLINKKGTPSISYNEAKYIDWVIDVNLAELDLDTNIVRDKLGDYLEFDLETLEIFQLEYKEVDGKYIFSEISPKLSEDEDFTKALNDNKDKLTINFSKGNIDKPYRIKYRSIIKGDAYDEGSYTNTGYIGEIGSGISSGDTVSPTINNIFEKESLEIDYEEKEFTWQIKVNPIKEKIVELEIEDTFTDGMLMAQEQFEKIKVEKNKVAFTNFTKTKKEENGKIKGFNIKFNEEVNGAEYIITYKTKIDPDLVFNIDDLKQLTYKNRAKFTWKDKLGDDLIKEATPLINEIAKTNGNKKGALDAPNKKIHWQVNLNYLSKNLEELVVDDEMSGNQKLIKDSVKVYKYTVNKEGEMSESVELSGDEKKNIAISEADDMKSFSVKFPKSINSPYRIEYSTEFEGISQTEYENTAITNYGEYYDKVDYSDGEKFVFKDGTINGQKSVDWKIVLNKSQSTISKITLTDTLSEGLLLTEESFKLFEGYNTETPVDFYEYFKIELIDKVLATDPQVFKIISRKEIDKTYTIQYQTDIIKEEILDQKLTNDVTFDGEGVEKGTRKDIKTVAATFVTGSGSGKGEVGKFKIVKVDGNNPELKLQGAKFKLYRGWDKNKYLGEVITDENGEFISPGLKYGKYLLKEIEAPVGYDHYSDEIKFVIDKKFEENILEVVVENTKIRGNIEILKADYSSGTALKDAKIAIYKKDGTLIDEKITDSTGKIKFEGLEYGQYYYKEIQAPSGYQKDNDKHLFTINEHEKVYEHTFSNRRIPDPTTPPVPEGRIRIIKRDSDSDKPLEGAEFHILDSSNKIVNTLITNSEGRASSKYLAPGSYTIEEVKAPKGYKIMTEVTSSTVIDEVINDITIYNDSDGPKDPEDPDEEIDKDDPSGRPEIDPNDPDEGLDGSSPGGRPSIPRLPTTGTKSSILLYGLGILSILIGILLRKKIKESN